MGRKRVPLSHREKWFIANAAQIEKDATKKRIAQEIGRSNAAMGTFINKTGLRPIEQKLQEALARFPARKKIPKIIALVQETKLKRNRSFREIARLCGVSLGFVLDTCEKQKLLSPDELKELKIFFKKIAITKTAIAERHTEYKSKYFKARELLRDTNLLQKQIAKKLGVSEKFVISANRGKGSDETIRSGRKQTDIIYGLKPINFFSLKQKLELIEPWKKKIAGRLKALNVPQSEWDRIISFVADSFFTKLDYFDPKRKISVEHFLSAYAGYYISHALREKKIKTVSLDRFKQRGGLTLMQMTEPLPPDAAAMREILSKISNLVSPLDKQLLLDQLNGMRFRAIAKKHGFSRQTALSRIKKAKEEISRAFKEKNE